MKTLLTGKNGQVGYELQRSLASLGEVVAIDVEDCDLTNSEQIVDLVERVKPGLIVNPAAYTAVDMAESEPEIAYAINATAPKVLAAQANLLHIPMIHYSTDYVFDGTKSGVYVEEDDPNPQSVYGKTKWQGEKNVRAMCPQHVILRTSWVFGAHGGNFLKTILKLAQERDELKIISDQFGAPTSARLLADFTAEIAKQMLCDDTTQKAGTYHLVGAGETTWHGYATKVVELANQLGVKTKVNAANIQPIPTEAYPLPAPRPKNSKLSTAKIRTTFGIDIPDWSVGVEQVLKQVIA
ncbi:dTDP-4-dehydrorhamnose reductase [Fluviibacter phosphoraccumulans]|uniref:dTDP-4-dehydrorhamnose reductase n=1 Tax=Fluviibacter phosphoraccumulans TaxID=1751046 RepID=UPI0010B26760|nr:dTDP-4-dehydrorhamnose reductase [Fluviibacter phosphoraccumulans]BCA66201.1 NAD(P)-dependent oxidoreductase [Fluviibacter phosphoraccumulans]